MKKKLGSNLGLCAKPVGAVSGGSTELGGCVWISTADHEGITVALVCMPGQ